MGLLSLMHSCRVNGEKRGTGSHANSIEEDLADINTLIARDIGDELNQVLPDNINIALDYDHPGKEYSPNVSYSSTSLSINSMSSVYANSIFSDDLKRKEKRMTPINCTGVSAAFGMIWKCKPCGYIQHQSKEDCYYYKHYHQPFHYIENNISNHPNELPIELEQRHDGIYTKEQGIKPFTRLGPLRGQVRQENEMDFDEDRSHIWLIYCENGERKCVLGTNWLRQISPADSSNSANLLAISMENDIYVVCGPAGIPPNTKLKYYAKEDPSTEFWTSCTQAWSNKKHCPRCSSHQKFDNISDYRVHISLWHDVSTQGNPQNRIYFCPDCCSKYVGAKEIVKHCQEAHASLPFKCCHCSKRFVTYNSLIKHKNRIHVEEKPLKKACELCGKIYLDPKSLKQHVEQVHKRSITLHCFECKFIFSSKYALNRHVRQVHQKHQDYVCTQCNKHFTQQSNLKQHMLIHIGAKPFFCKQKGCQAAFTTKQCLQRHYIKLHHFNQTNIPTIQKVNLDRLLNELMNHKNTDDYAGLPPLMPIPKDTLVDLDTTYK